MTLRLRSGKIGIELCEERILDGHFVFTRITVNEVRAKGPLFAGSAQRLEIPAFAGMTGRCFDFIMHSTAFAQAKMYVVV